MFVLIYKYAFSQSTCYSEDNNINTYREVSQESNYDTANPVKQQHKKVVSRSSIEQSSFKLKRIIV